MEKFKKIILLLIMAVVGTGMANAFIDSYTVNRDKLPEAAREMLDEHFPKAKISMIKIDRHLLKKPNFDVKLVNGSKIEFSNSGKWKSIDCKNRAVPEALVPKAIRNHVSKNYPEVKIVKIEKKSAGYEIGLSDELNLKYNLLGQFKGVENDD